MKYIALFSVLSFLIFACGETDSSRADDISSLTGDLTAGEALFTTNCVQCHGASGTGTALGPSVLATTKDAIISITISGLGTMPSYSAWSDQEIADCATYVESL